MNVINCLVDSLIGDNRGNVTDLKIQRELSKQFDMFGGYLCNRLDDMFYYELPELAQHRMRFKCWISDKLVLPNGDRLNTVNSVLWEAVRVGPAPLWLSREAFNQRNPTLARQDLLQAMAISIIKNGGLK